MATSTPDLASMIASAVAEALASMTPAEAPKGRGKGRGKGAAKDASGVGREGSFSLANLKRHQGIKTLRVGQTFTYNRAKGRGSSQWKVASIEGDAIIAVKVA